MKINLDRIREQFELMQSIGATSKGGVTRLTLSEGDKQARDLLCSFMEVVGLEVTVDDIGNIYGKRAGSNPNANPIVVGSHLDSIENSGKFDGVLGILCGLEIIRVFNEQGVTTRNPIIIANFTNEEGHRFKPLLSGVGVLSGDFDLESVYKDLDQNGITFLEALQEIGYLGSKENRLHEAEAFIELHIEQGPILDRKKISIGAVEGILGLTWLEVTVIGKADNSGPTPMEYRKDALHSTAKMVLVIDQIAREMGNGTITTVGEIEVVSGTVNTVPGEVKFTVDVRNSNDQLKNSCVNKIVERLKEIANEAELFMEVKELWSTSATTFSNELVDSIIEFANMYGYSVEKMVSGASHVSTFMNKICPTVMIFVPSIEGISHCPEENTDWKDIEKGGNILLTMVKKLAIENNGLKFSLL